MSIKKLEHINIVTINMAATLDFYCNTLGFVNKKRADRPHNAFIAIEVNSDPILHIIDVNFPPTSSLQRLAIPSPIDNIEFRAGPIDHLGFVYDFASYEKISKSLKEAGYLFQLDEHPNGKRKQLRVLDPNGVGIELIFQD